MKYHSMDVDWRMMISAVQGFKVLKPLLNEITLIYFYRFLKQIASKPDLYCVINHRHHTFKMHECMNNTYVWCVLLQVSSGALGIHTEATLIRQQW